MEVLEFELRPITVIHNREVFTIFVEYVPLKNLLPVLVGQASVLINRRGVYLNFVVLVEVINPAEKRN